MIGRGQTANKGIGPVRKEKYTQDDIDAAVAAEREACAEIAELWAYRVSDWNNPENYIIARGDSIAASIRARGKQP